MKKVLIIVMFMMSVHAVEYRNPPTLQLQKVTVNKKAVKLELEKFMRSHEKFRRSLGKINKMRPGSFRRELAIKALQKAWIRNIKDLKLRLLNLNLPIGAITALPKEILYINRSQKAGEAALIYWYRKYLYR